MVNPGEKILVLRLGDELYGLEVNHIQEILESPRLHYIPCAGPHYLGAINFHGIILPVIDLAGHLGLDQDATDPRIIVLPPQLCCVALAVHAIAGIIPLNQQGLISHKPQTQQPLDCIRAILQNSTDLINLFDMDRLLAGFILE